MNTRRSPADSDVHALGRAIDVLERRVAAIEARLTDPRLAAPLAEPGPSGATAAQSPASALDAGVFASLALVGRTLMVIGGAYLLRAVTEGGVLPPPAGVAAGLTYAGVWLVLCAREARNRRRTNAAFHGLAASLIAYPLIAEATARFALIRPGPGAALLAVFTGVLLVVAFRTRIESVAWFGTSGAAVTGISLAIATGAYHSYTVVLILTAIAALWLGYLRDWVFLRWPAAAVANLMVLALAIRLIARDGSEPAGPTLALLLFVATAYLGSFVARTLFLAREVIPFEVAQSAAVMLVGFGAAIAVLHALDHSTVPLGSAAVLLGAGGYAFAFGFVAPRRHWRNLAFYLGLAVAFTTGGVALLVPAPAAVVVFAVLTAICLEAARRTRRVTLSLHAGIYAVAAAIGSGLLTAAAQGLLASTARAWSPLTPGMALALAAVVAAVLWTSPMPPRHWTSGARAVRVGSLILLIWCATGFGLVVAIPALAGTPGAVSDAGIAATLRTTVLLGAIVALLVSPSVRWSTERAWVAYGLLGAAGLKLLAEDLPKGRPATLFIGLALYGAALILAPGIARQRMRRGAEALAEAKALAEAEAAPATGEGRLAMPVEAMRLETRGEAAGEGAMQGPRSIVLVSVIVAVATCAAACGRVQPSAAVEPAEVRVSTTPDEPIRAGQRVEVPPPPFSDGIFPCSDCHAGVPADRTRRELMMHDDIVLKHGGENRWCLDCHNADDRDQLHLASGEPVPFDESYRLCGQCHGEKYRDWRAGVHGRRSGEWNGQKSYLLCAHCHNPHAPRFAPIEPKPAPVPPSRQSGGAAVPMMGRAARE